jgi:hypothetical protein
LAAIAAAGVAILAIGLFRGRQSTAPAAAEGYRADFATLTQEYEQLYGRPLRDPELSQHFRTAGEMAAAKNYLGAIDALEKASKDAGVPVVFHDLGVLYAANGDRARSITSFREALARNADYAPTREGINRIPNVTLEETRPLRREAEPNNSYIEANIIALDGAADGEIAVGDVDTYKFITPAPPRDVLQVEIENLDPALELGVRIHDKDSRFETGRLSVPVGQSLKRTVSQPPNTPLFVQVSGGRDSSGKYRVSVKALKSFDALEPNEDILSTRRIELGRKIEANIMDTDDSDFYSFQSTRNGTVTVELKNESGTLIPALTTFSPDRRNTGFGPDIRKPGSDLKHSIEVIAYQTYYLQIWSQGQTSGKYSLTIQ